VSVVSMLIDQDRIGKAIRPGASPFARARVLKLNCILCVILAFALSMLCHECARSLGSLVGWGSSYHRPQLHKKSLRSSREGGTQGASLGRGHRVIPISITVHMGRFHGCKSSAIARDASSTH
jgi:hypothetical protein